jgi:ElaB/YqjD/DUF883 family membrane-anchored ribosome-binding protein
MAQESIENMTDPSRPHTRKVVLMAQDVAERAGSFVQQQAERLSSQAQGLAREANDRVKEHTGRPLDAWISEVRSFVRAHPIQALAATIGVGYILGKIVKR